jgi:hypothetical protein
MIFGLAFLSIAYLAAYNSMNLMGYKIDEVPFEKLYFYQQEKAEKSKADLIFIGDSSLGNAINAGLFSSLAGLDAENYALTGSFGLHGSFDMLQKVHAHDRNLKTVVLMQTADIFTRKNPSQFRPTKKYFKSEHFNGVQLNIYNYATFRLFADRLFGGKAGKDKKYELANDYIRQGEPIDAHKELRPIAVKKIEAESTQFLNEIDRYCRKKKLNCIFAYGPLAEDICKGSGAYMERANGFIAATGLSFAGETPVCIPRNKLGDSTDHVRAEYKDDYTRAYYRLLKPYIFRKQGASSGALTPSR